MITDAMVEAAVEAWEKRYDADCDPGERWRDNRYHAMRAALSAAIPAAWQDIGTAPRCTRVLVRTAGCSIIDIAEMINSANGWIWRTDHNETQESGYFEEGEPTHWMPLPAPPADGAGR